MTAAPLDPARLAEILGGFEIAGELQGVTAFERGHIHDTFVSRWRTPTGPRRFLHQRLNEAVFPDIEALMGNVERVTSHLARKLAEAGGGAGFRPLRLVPTRGGAGFLRRDGRAWRTYPYLEGTRSLEACEGPAQAREAARAVGRFQAWLADLEPSELAVPIPHFFSTPHRYREFDAALAADRAGRAAEVAAEIAFVTERRELAGAFEERLESGRLPRRVVHGDTKLNNILFDERGERAVSLVDLDTCMGAWSLYDYGDLVRFTAATSAEDERDLSRAGVDPCLRDALTEGYLAEAEAFLTDEERGLLPLAARLVTLTIGLRFLTDHLNGDTYFKVARHGQNLDRARVQFRMVACLEED